MFKGSIVAIITPFKDGKVDELELRELIELQIESGTSGIVPCGTTGESPTLSHAEHDQVVEITVDQVKGRVPVIAGTGSNSTAEAIRLTQHAKDCGADGALVVTPYYNKPTQQGLYLHFKAIADAVDIPIILYNIEGRCAKNIETPTVARLAKDCKNIVGVKEASGNLDQARDVRAACGDDFAILSGDDALTIPMLELGGVGTVSVLANIMPKETAQVINEFNAGNTEKAAQLQEKLLPLISALFIESNPSPVKQAAELMGLCLGDVRLPLCRMEQGNIEKLKIEMEKIGLLVNA